MPTDSRGDTLAQEDELVILQLTPTEAYALRTLIKDLDQEMYEEERSALDKLEASLDTLEN